MRYYLSVKKPFLNFVLLSVQDFESESLGSTISSNSFIYETCKSNESFTNKPHPCCTIDNFFWSKYKLLPNPDSPVPTNKQMLSALDGPNLPAAPYLPKTVEPLYRKGQTLSNLKTEKNGLETIGTRWKTFQTQSSISVSPLPLPRKKSKEYFENVN